MPRISILTPVFNSRYLPELIESVLMQTITDWEMVCVNDGSPDNSLEVLRSYAARESRIKVIDQKNTGINGAINNGLRFTSGDYVLIIGHDDCMSPDLLENVCRRAFETDADCIIPDVEMSFNLREKAWFWNEAHKTDLSEIITSREAFSRTFPWRIHLWAFWRGEIIRSTEFIQISDFNSDEYTARVLLFKCQRIAFCPGAYRYRYHSESISRVLSIKQFDVFITNEKLLELAMAHSMDSDTINRIKRQMISSIINRISLLEFYSKFDRIKARKKIKEAYKYYSKLNPKAVNNKSIKGRIITVLSNNGLSLLYFASYMRRFLKFNSKE